LKNKRKAHRLKNRLISFRFSKFGVAFPLSLRSRHAIRGGGLSVFEGTGGFPGACMKQVQ